MMLRIAFACLALLLMACSPEAPKETSSSTETVAEAVVEEMTPEAEPVDVNEDFIPASFTAPVLVETEKFKLVPLGPKLVKIDFDAYMSSIEHLQKTFTRSTNWPREGITDAEAMLDMETEQARFENRESFAYGVLTPDGTREIGSFYVRPSPVPEYDAVVRMWVTKADYDAGYDELLYTWGKEWVETEWPFENVAYPGRAIEWAAWDAKMAEVEVQTAENVKTAEGFIDGFYSFDPEQLGAFLTETDETAARILDYQGWAEGGNYKVVNRGACEPKSVNMIVCPITVEDDPVQALKTGFDVTDTFHLTFANGSIAHIETSSNDQPIYYEARKWVEANMPEVITGPCKRSESGSRVSPGDCARAMTKGYAAFYAATQMGKAEGDS